MGSTTLEQQFVRTEAGTLVGYPPVLAVPSSVTVRLRTPAVDMPLVGEAATVDAVNDVFASAAARGATSITLTGTEPGTYNLTEAQAAVQVELLALGVDAFVVLTFLADYVTAGLTVAGFTAALASQETTLETSAGRAFTDAEIAAVIAAFAAVVILPPTVVDGRLYLITDADTGTVFVVEASASVTALTIELQEPLPTGVSVGSTFRGWACLLAVDAVDTDKIGRGVAVWEATAAGVVQTWTQVMRVVARVVAYDLTAADVTRLSPYSARLKPADDEDWVETLDAAWNLEMIPQLLAKGLRPERIVSWQALNPWHVAEVEKRLAEQHETDADIRAEKVANALTKATLALSSIAFWYDDADDLAPDSEDPNAVRPWSVSYVTR